MYFLLRRAAKALTKNYAWDFVGRRCDSKYINLIILEPNPLSRKSWIRPWCLKQTMIYYHIGYYISFAHIFSTAFESAHEIFHTYYIFQQQRLWRAPTVSLEHILLTQVWNAILLTSWIHQMGLTWIRGLHIYALSNKPLCAGPL